MSRSISGWKDLRKRNELASLASVPHKCTIFWLCLSTSCMSGMKDEFLCAKFLPSANFLVTFFVTVLTHCKAGTKRSI